MGSAVASTSTGKTGETEQGEGARGRNIDNETVLHAGSSETLVPSDLEGRTGEIKGTVVRKATDEDSETSGGITDLAIEARGASVVPTGKVAGVGSTVAAEVRVKTRTGTGTR